VDYAQFLRKSFYTGSSPPHPRLSYLFASREAPPQIQPDQPFNSLPESSASTTPPGGSPGP